jgi:RNA polymerase sigma-70 factor (ECF subfamily)
MNRTFDVKKAIDQTKLQEGLIVAAIGGDRDAVGELYNGYSEFIRYYCRKFIYNPEEVENAHSEVTLRMVLRINTLKDPLKFIGWLYGLVNNTCLEINRKEKANRSKFLPYESYEMLHMADANTSGDPHEGVEHRDLEAVIFRALETLPRRQKELVECFYIQQMSYEEIEKKLSISQGSIAKNLSRARKNLRSQMEEKGYAHALGKAGFAGTFLTSIEHDAMFEMAAGIAKGGATSFVKAILSGIAILLSGALFVAFGLLPQDEEPKDNLAPNVAAQAIHQEAAIYFDSEYAGSETDSSNLPERYNPEQAILTDTHWTPERYTITQTDAEQGGSEASTEYRNGNAVAEAESDSPVINIQELGLTPGEYLITWKLVKGTASAEATRSFVIS